MFVLGNIEPDLNPFSYFRGFLKRPFFGHNWENSKNYIISSSIMLQKNSLRTFDLYRLGVLVHYLCDAFTYTHNCCFKGGLIHHTHYEKELHKALCFRYDRPFSGCNSHDKTTSLPREIFDLHKAYERLPSSLEKDVDFITLAVETALSRCI